MQKIFSEGKTHSTKNFLLYSLDNSQNNQLTKFGVVISKKISKKATERNYCKRVVREIVMAILPKIKQGVFFVLVIRQNISSTSFDTLESEIYKIMKYV